MKSFINIVKRGTMLDDAPWTWGSAGGWTKGMPAFFAGVQADTQASDYPLMFNVYDELDTDPHTWNYSKTVGVSPPKHRR